MSNTWKGSSKDNLRRLGKLEGKMLRITESWMESWIVNRLNITVKHLLMP